MMFPLPMSLLPERAIPRAGRNETFSLP
jgi:hypothetical protein